MYLKVHTSGGRSVVALCDEDLIGKTLEQGKLRLEISERFYKGDKLSEKEILPIIKNSENLNIVGEKSINFALKHKIITQEHIIKIKGVPHAQIYAL